MHGRIEISAYQPLGRRGFFNFRNNRRFLARNTRNYRLGKSAYGVGFSRERLNPRKAQFMLILFDFSMFGRDYFF